MIPMQKLTLLVPLAPLLGALVAGLFCRVLPRWVAHTVTTGGVAVAFIASLLIFQDVQAGHTYNGSVYTWLISGDVRFEIGFLIDNLTALMMLVVSFVSLMVHFYTIGYMRDDPGYNRFFAYIALFTFSMLMLVMSNNFLQLFFGWEAVGLVSYLLIGFWFERPSAVTASLKAFLVNRAGDFGLILGIGLIMAHFGSLDYAAVFHKAPELKGSVLNLWGSADWSLLTVVCLCLFIGAMGKSAQVPLHVWLPDSMEGPTPISALIHAATMVTAGIFMVARLSPLFELSTTALSFMLVIGAVTALFMGLLGIVQTDIKRIIAYSTLSQLGYMTVALGASAYSAAIFHLMTHAFFKALLFLAAGSVIIALHHEQNIMKMGGLRKTMPITWLTALAGSLALIGTPLFSGFYSKDAIIEVVGLSQIPGAGFAHFAVLAGVFITALYTFRLFFLVFHGRSRSETGSGHAPHEAPWVMWLPLVLLAIPSLAIGYVTLEPVLLGNFFDEAIRIDAMAHPAFRQFKALPYLSGFFEGPLAMAAHGLTRAPFLLAAAGVLCAWIFTLKRPDWAAALRRKCTFLGALLDKGYYFDWFYETVLAGGARLLGRVLWRSGDAGVIDAVLVRASVWLVGLISRAIHWCQTGYVYHYAFTMMIGLLLLMVFWVRLG